MHTFLLYFAALSAYFEVNNCQVQLQFMSSTTTVSDEVLITRGCAVLIFTTKNHHQCIRECFLDVSCVGITLDISDREYCVVHTHCGIDDLHTDESADLYPTRRFFSKICAHNGRWDPTQSKCHCVDGWVGVRCLDLPKDHTGILTAGYPTGNPRTYLDLRSKGMGLVPVTLAVDPPSYHNVRLLAHTGQMNFNRSWADFRHGFYQDELNLWAGLHTWWAVNQIGYTRMTIVLYFKSHPHVYRSYRFTISNEAEGYAINSIDPSLGGWVSGGTSTNPVMGDCFGSAWGAEFSTFDNDNDGVPESSCAAKTGVGWWYKDSCNQACNFLGRDPTLQWSGESSQLLSVPGITQQHLQMYGFDHVLIYAQLASS